jgi:hypothetical protein
VLSDGLGLIFRPSKELVVHVLEPGVSILTREPYSLLLADCLRNSS